MTRPARRLVACAAAAGLAAVAAFAPAPAALAQTPPSWAAPVVSELTPVSATLSWTSPTTDPEVTYYRIYRVTTRNGAPYERFINATTTTSFRAVLLTPDTEYTYFVETGDQTSNGLRSERVTFRTLPAPDDSQPPTPPGAPEATSLGPNSLSLSWAPSEDNDGVVAYHVYRTKWQDQVERAAVVVVVGGNDSPSKTFQRVLPDFDYTFHVVAVDAAGNESAPSPSLSLRTPADPASVCQVTYTTMDFGGMFEARIDLHNSGVVHEVWTIRFTLPEGQQVLWGAAQSGTEGIITYEGWADLMPLGWKTFDFYGTRTGSLLPAATDFRLNGQPCT